jgi:hypothetical protein
MAESKNQLANCESVEHYFALFAIDKDNKKNTVDYRKHIFLLLRVFLSQIYKMVFENFSVRLLVTIILSNLLF